MFRLKSIEHGLNKAQIKALAKIEHLSDKVFQDVLQNASIPVKGHNDDGQSKEKPKLNEFSAREIQVFAEELEKSKEQQGKYQKTPGCFPAEHDWRLKKMG